MSKKHEQNGVGSQRADDLDLKLTTRILDYLNDEEASSLVQALNDPANEKLRITEQRTGRLTAELLQAMEGSDVPPSSPQLRAAVESELDASWVGISGTSGKGNVMIRRRTWLAAVIAASALLILYCVNEPAMQKSISLWKAEPKSVIATAPAGTPGTNGTGENSVILNVQDGSTPFTVARPEGESRFDLVKPPSTDQPLNAGASSVTAAPIDGKPIERLWSSSATPDERKGASVAASVHPTEMKLEQMGMGGMAGGAAPGMSMGNMPGLPYQPGMGAMPTGPSVGMRVSRGGPGAAPQDRLDLYSVADPKSAGYAGPGVVREKELGDLEEGLVRGRVLYESLHPTEGRDGFRFTRDHSNEGYDAIQENGFRVVRDQPLSTFSIDVDTASYANVRRFLSQGQLPPADAVRIEELLNYFSYEYPQPEGDDPFSVNMEVAECPWRPENRLLRVGLKGRDIPKQKRAATSLVFLIDVSGSMQPENKLPLIKTSLRLLVKELTEDDRVSIVTYAGDAGLKLPSTNGTEQNRILGVIESLSAGGSTHGSAGINLAYEQATANFIRGGTNRVILLTDGDLNVGITDDGALVDLIQEKAKTGVFLTVLGVGDGNLKDSKMEKLADHGNGIYGYIDSVREARKIFVEQLSGSLMTIAKDVKFQIEFNPAQVQAYRLIGYENRVLANRDFHDDTKDAGEIGAGHTVTALYELVPASGTVPPRGEGLRYQPQVVEKKTETAPENVSHELLTLKLRFKRPDEDRSHLRDYPLANHGGKFGQASNDFRFASSVAMFGLVLRGSQYRGNATLAAVEEIASSTIGNDQGGYRSEFVDLVRKAAERK